MPMLTRPKPSSPNVIIPRITQRLPHMFVSAIMTLMIVAGTGLSLAAPTYAATDNVNCTLIVPANPLTAEGLATPYQLVATDAAAGPCNEANVNQSAFVQGTILNPATGAFSIYNPLVIDQGTQPLVVPTAPTLPARAIVSLHMGFNATLLTLAGPGVNQPQSNCVNGLAGSVFGQFAYCNAANLFNAANRLIVMKKITVPPLGTALNGKPCETVRDFAVVDMDQSDNVQTQYLVNANGQTAQLTAANQANQAGTTVIGNPSDNALLSKIIDPALGCKPWTAPDLADNGNPVDGLVLDELQARQFQQAPVALVPGGDPMTLVNNVPSLAKVNAYRRGVDQTPANTLRNVATANNTAPANSANTVAYCANLINTGIPRILLDQNLTMNAASPAPGAANNLFNFLATRLLGALGADGLNCVGLLNIANPVTLTTDANGVTTAATIVATKVTVTKPSVGTEPSHPNSTRLRQRLRRRR